MNAQAFNFDGWEETMKKLIFTMLLVALAGSSAVAGNCQHHNDTASDGSVCGNRSADDKAGGN
ncbi:MULTISPECIES: hypothetical protein [unclassified Rhizobium]|uniref:hypothetical protein n=1 Tax=unclassified Rhizobium TaxID=2613769 RepID=UPI001FFE08F6|nr:MULTISPECIES: hypothetical protein [unclassified Rhizobium]